MRSLPGGMKLQASQETPGLLPTTRNKAPRYNLKFSIKKPIKDEPQNSDKVLLKLIRLDRA